jgi:mevalonate kinase
MNIESVALKAFLELLKLLGIVKKCRLVLKSEIPIGAGLGSSASFAVCMSAALLLFQEKISLPFSQSDLELVNEYAFEAEKVIHGNPSGVDNAIVTFGGAKLFEKGEKLKDLVGFRDVEFLLTNTNVSKNTKLQVQLFKERLEMVSSLF